MIKALLSSVLLLAPCVVLASSDKGSQATPANVFDVAAGSAVQILSSGSGKIGSGVWVSEDGYVATCWHVVKDATGEVVVNASLSVYEPDYAPGTIITATFATTRALVVAHDDAADVAILKVAQNPFKGPQTALIATPKGEVRHKYIVPLAKPEFPHAGEQVVLAGFPLGRPDLISQSGNVAGWGELDRGLPSAFEKRVRIFVSVVSNPANSGGPVLDGSGMLVGLLEGNLTSPQLDELNRRTIYLRPQRDADGNVLPNAAPETAYLNQNSGISIIVPVKLVTPCLKEAQKTVANSTLEQLRHMVPRRTPLAGLSKESLRTYGNNLVAEVGQFAQGYKVQADRLSEEDMARLRQARSDEERKSIDEELDRRLEEVRDRERDEFADKFSLKVTWFEDEILFRLPSTPSPQFYDRSALNPDWVLRDLERFVKLLD